LNTQVEHLDNHTARLSVEITRERVDKAMHEAARRLAKEYNIPGFRKGKAPYNIILQRFGEKNLLNEALDVLGNEVFKEALDEAKIEPYAPGVLENVETEPNVKLIFVIQKQPEVDLGNYREIRVPFEAAEVTDEAVTQAMKNLQDQRALVEPATRPAQIGDQIKAHVYAEAVHPATEDHDHEGEEKHEHTDTYLDQDITTILTDNEEEDRVMPGFSQNVVGMSAGEEKEFSMAFPADYKEAGLAGHVFTYKVMLKEVESRTLPALNDDFAKQVTENQMDNLLDLRIDIRKQLQDTATRDAESKYSDEVLDKVVEQGAIKYPEDMVQEYIDDILKSMDRNLRERGLSLADYQRIENKSDEAMRTEYRDAAIKRLQRALILGELVNKEQLDVSDADIDAQIEKMSAQFGEQASIFRSMLMRNENKRGIALDLITNRALQRLMQIARGENPAIGPSPEPEPAAIEAPAVQSEQPAVEAEAATESASEPIVEPTADAPVNAPTDSETQSS
jgi:trigger factor